MPNVIDTLVVELSLDPAKFTAAQQQAINLAKQAVVAHQQAAEQIEAAGKRLENFYAGLKREALGFVAAFFGARGIKEFVEYITKADAALGRAAHTLDMSATELSAWQGVSRATGGTAESMTGSLQGLTDQIQRGLATGQWGSMLQVFSRFGINLRDSNGQLKTSGQLLLDLNAVFSRMDPARARAILQMLGMDPSTINVILMNRSALLELYSAQQTNAAASEADVQAAGQLQKLWNEAATAAENLGRKIMTWIITPLGSPVLKAAAAIFGAIARVIDAAGKGTLHGAGARAAAEHAATQGSNMQNFLAGLSYLESDHRTDATTSGSSARGAFQFTSATRQQAMDAGLGDPWAGNYDQQAAVTAAFIERFHPDAAAAIKRGDFAAAAMMLNKRWPSLPGGSQPQSASRYQTFGKELQGGGPRPTGAAAAAVTNNTTAGDTTTTTNTASVTGPINIHIAGGADADGVARSIRPALKRALTGIMANTGPQ